MSRLVTGDNHPSRPTRPLIGLSVLNLFGTFCELASDEVAQGGAVVPPVETPVLVAAVHANLEDGLLL